MIYILFQGAIAQILENTKDDFFSKILNIIREAADICLKRFLALHVHTNLKGLCL